MEQNNFFKNQVKTLVNDQHVFQKLENYINLIERKNQVMNLTGFTGDQLWGEGILESIVLMQNSFNNKIFSGTSFNFLDIGAGAGFPSIPYLITLKETHFFTIYEPNQKRVDFLNLVKKTLNLENLTIKNVRSEDVLEFEQFDFITARAVSELKNLVQISHHLGKLGAWYSFIKGPKYQKEILQATKNLKNFGKINFIVKKIEINGIVKSNYLIMFQKSQLTPKNYPLKWTKIIK